MAAYASLVSLSQTADLNANQHKYLFSLNAEEKIRSIHEYVIFLLSFLQDFPKKANRWEGKMTDVAHETEDIIENFMSQQLFYERMGYEQMGQSSPEFEDQLKIVAEKLCLMTGDMTDERPASSHAAVSSSSTSSSSSAAAAGVATTRNDAVIGLHDDVMVIKDRLCGMSSKRQVVPVVGMGGIGKTTLARIVYDDQVIMKHFHIRVWLTISQDYSAHKILLDLLNSMGLNGEKMSSEKIDDSEMIEIVYKNLIGRRYLIVLDDVWSTKVWDDVRNIFPDDCNGSRIMLTTRESDLAAYPDSNSPLHEMRIMNDSQSWDLLKEKVFANSCCPPELEDVGKEIARSCGGLPLVVVVVAGFLSAVNRTPFSWREIAKNVNPIVDQDLEKILSSSYTHLPHHLRPCFLFVGGFPEDANIQASRLIKLWVAEGFLKHRNRGSKSLEEEAEEYLEDLVKRNLVTVTSRKSNGKIKSCSLHDMIRELCIRKARDEKFLCFKDHRVMPWNMINERHISFRHRVIDNIWCPTIRTIPCFQLEEFPREPSFLRCFRLVRVLNVVGRVLNVMDENRQELPSEVFELFHLRYLALICSTDIPSAISNLVNLQTLIILPTDLIDPTIQPWKTYWNVKYISLFSLPLEIWRMPQLRHLICYGSYMLPHPPNGSNIPLENLQTLLPVEDLVWSEKILQMIPNVKRLGLVYTFNKEYHLHHLKHLYQLEKLEVHGYHSFSWMQQKPTFPWTLRKLTLMGGRFPWEDMTIIGSLPNLQVLKLLNHACYGETWETRDEEFPRLKFLLIDTSELEQWITKSSHFPRLNCLVLRTCLKLREIPEGIGEIPTLELIELDCCNPSLVESAKQIDEDQKSYGNYALQVRVETPQQTTRNGKIRGWHRRFEIWN